MRSKLLMCPPKYFGVDYSINVWMQDKIGTVDANLAFKQWQSLFDALNEYAIVDLLEPQSGLPDMVFTANAGLKVGSKFFLSKFKHSERVGEEQYFRSWAFYNQLIDIEQNFCSFEGEGDCLRDAFNVYWMGFGFRSDREYVNVLRDLGLKAQAVELVDNRFYHIDTCFCPFPDGRLMYFPDAFSTKSQQMIEESFNSRSKHEIIKVTDAEAATFCCNAVILNKHVFMPNCESVAEKLTALGYIVHQFDMSEFLKSGGACKCLVLHV